jgi:hypothetical protein
MARNKTNPLLASFEAKLEARYRQQLKFSNQLGLDAAMIAANEVLGLGAGRAAKFRSVYIKTINEMAAMLAEDGKDDPELEWSIATIDKRLQSIMGDNFKPWDERYRR